MIENENIICFGPADWWGRNPSCTTHIIKRLSKSNRIFYVNTFNADLSGGIKKGMARRFKRKIKSLAKFLKKPQKNIYVFSPVFLPFQGNKFFDIMNNFILWTQLKLCCLFLKMKKPILWLENPRAADAIDWFKPKLKIYHVSDLFNECSYTKNKQALIQREQLIRNKSDLIICVSKKLYQHNLNLGGEVYYLPHGVDFERFRTAIENKQIYRPLKDINKPIIGYYGTLTAQNNIEILEYCAENLKDFTFVFGGQITGGDYSKLQQLPNTKFLGQIPYEEIPKLCASFDLCLLPWKVSPWIIHCNPLKLQEYMASGSPIVSVPIDQVKTLYSQLVSVAENKEDFCNAICWELKNDTPVRKLQRIETARQNSWDKKIQQLSDIIENHLNSKNKL